MKKIAILAPYVGIIDRGAETFVIELSRRLMKEYQIDIYTTGCVNELKKCIVTVDVDRSVFMKLHQIIYDKNKIYRMFCNKIYWIIPDIIFQKKFTKKVFEKYIANKNYDIIFPNNGIWGAIYANKLREKRKIPFIYTGHGGVGIGEKFILQEKPDWYIALTKHHEVWAKKLYEKVIKISNGIDCENFSSNISPEKKKNKNVVIMVAAFTAFKRHKLAIDAISLLDDFSLILLGKGELYQEILEYGKSKLNHRFEILSVPYGEIKSYYEKANVFTLPSKDEPFGIVYLEAMAMGLPVVAPDDIVRREIVEDAGFLCDCENSQQYAMTILNAVNYEWKDKPRKQALKFSWDKIAEEYKKVIEGLT